MDENVNFMEERRIPIGMDIAIKKIELIQWLTNLEDEAMIRKLEKVKKAVGYPLRPMTTEELESRLSRSEKDIKEGRVYSHDQVEKYFKNKSKG
jgi:predicted metalloendopeptidase